jgi:hypothetical protein
MSQLRPGETRAPHPGIEAALDAAMSGQLPLKDFLLAFADAPVIVVSASDVAADPSQLRPLLFTPADVSLMSVFTARDRANRWKEQAPFSTTLLGRQVFEGLQEGVGVVVNPGFGLGFELHPAGIPAILEDLQSVRVPGLPDPNVVLEQAIVDAQTGDATPEQLLHTFATTRVYVLSHTDDGLEPITFVREDAPALVGVFTRPDFAQQFTDDVPFALYVEAGWLATQLPEGVGIVVNPGTAAPWELSPEVVASVDEG